jgi:hypothetical protein
MSRSVRVILGVVLVLVLLAGGAGGLIWWKLSSLKTRLVAGLGKSLGAEVQVESITIDPWKSELHAAGIRLVNQRAAAPWDKGAIAQATVRYHLADVFASTMPVTVEISSWNVVLHSPLRTAETPPDSPATGDAAPSDNAPPKPGWIHVNHLVAQDGSVEVQFSDDRKVSFEGVTFDSTNDGGDVWTTQLQASSIKAGTMDIGKSSVEVHADADKITFSDLRMQCTPGAITGDGEVATGGAHDAKLTLKAVDVPVTMLVAIDWQTQLTGLATVDLTYTGNDQGGAAQGTVSIAHGKFNVLPWLGKVTSLVGLPDISGVEVDKATTDFTWKDHALHLANIDVRKTGATRIAGSVDVDPQGVVDGKLRLGLPNAITAKWPALQTTIFPVQFEDYSWADVHLTGTSNHLQEDLTPRLAAAVASQGSDMLKQTTQKAGDLINGIIGK